MAPKESTFKPFKVAYGAEDFHLDRVIEKACQGKRKIVRLDGEGLTDVALVAHCEAYEEAPRTIILDNAQELKGADDLKAFIAARDNRDQSLILLAIVRGTKLPAVWQLPDNKGTTFEHKKPKPWATDTYIDFVVSEAALNHVNISKEVATLLAEFVGPDLYRLANEVRKLAIYVGRAHSITKEHVLLVTTRTPQAEPSMIAEEAIRKNATKAINLFSILYGNVGEQKACVPVLNALMKQVERTLVIRTLQDKGTSDDDIPSLIDMNPWHYKKSLSGQVARKHDVKSLVGHMRQLCKLDAYVKTGSLSKRTMVELTILSIAQ
jgi:DNA polymerase III delta subunit